VVEPDVGELEINGGGHGFDREYDERLVSAEKATADEHRCRCGEQALTTTLFDCESFEGCQSVQCAGSRPRGDTVKAVSHEDYRCSRSVAIHHFRLEITARIRKPSADRLGVEIAKGSDGHGYRFQTTICQLIFH
jgi:hypothetical protein